MEGVRAAVAAAYRDHYGAVVAPLVRVTGSFERAEELAQEAFAIALDRWERDGVPSHTLPWLRRVAKNLAIDTLRRERRFEEKRASLAAESDVSAAQQAFEPGQIQDDALRLVFTCCHPALAIEARVALTLTVVCGLTSDEVARAFLVSRPTVQQRLVRAKRKIDRAGIRYEVPEASEMEARLDGVIRTLYVVFTEGYASTKTPGLVRPALCDEAIRLARLVHDAMPDQCDVGALLALMLLQHARTPARVSEGGQLVRLPDQDRMRWDRAAIDEALPLVEASLRSRPVSRFALEAAIAALHARAPSAEATDWPQIAALYGEFGRRGFSDPILDLNRAVALAMSGDVGAGLALVDGLEASGRLERYHPLYVARAELSLLDGDPESARGALEQAAALTQNPTERAHLLARAGEVSSRAAKATSEA